MRLLPVIILFLLGVGCIGFALFTVLLEASDTQLKCLGDSKTCVYTDTALLRWEHKDFKYDDIVESRVKESYYTPKGGSRVYSYTTQLVTKDNILNVITCDSQIEAQNYAIQINNMRNQNRDGKVQGNNLLQSSICPSLFIEYSDKKLRYNSGIMLVIIGLFSIGIGFFRFLKGR